MFESVVASGYNSTMESKQYLFLTLLREPYHEFISPVVVQSFKKRKIDSEVIKYIAKWAAPLSTLKCSD